MVLENLLKIVFGLFLIVLGLYGLVNWWGSFLILIKESIPIFVLFLGILFVILGFEK